MAELDMAAVTADLQQDEGLKLLVYDDATGKFIKPGVLVVGHPTIGYGRALDVRGITGPEAALLLAHDIPAFDTELAGVLPWYTGLDGNRRRVLLEMAFNMGVGDSAHGLLSFHQMLDAVEAGDWVRAKANMVASHWFVQVGPRRAARLANLMLNGR